MNNSKVISMLVAVASKLSLYDRDPYIDPTEYQSAVRVFQYLALISA